VVGVVVVVFSLLLVGWLGSFLFLCFVCLFVLLFVCLFYCLFYCLFVCLFAFLIVRWALFCFGFRQKPKRHCFCQIVFVCLIVFLFFFLL